MIEAYGNIGDETCGMFLVRGMTVIASSDGGWDHVSASRPDRCPTWSEMDSIKRMFFKPDETCWQYHVAGRRHISIHPYCLHIWRKQDFDMPMPPSAFV